MKVRSMSTPPPNCSSSFMKDSPNSSLPSSSPSPPSTSTSYEGQNMTHVSFSRTRTIIAVLVAILIFAGLITLLLCLGVRGRGHTTGERELQPITGTAETAGTRRRQGIIQIPLGAPPPPYRYPPRPSLPNPLASWSQTTTTNPFSNRFSIPQRIRDRCPRLPAFTSALLPEFTLLFYTPASSRARVPHPADPVAQPNTQPPSTDFSNPPFNDMPYIPSPV